MRFLILFVLSFVFVACSQDKTPLSTPSNELEFKITDEAKNFEERIIFEPDGSKINLDQEERLLEYLKDLLSNDDWRVENLEVHFFMEENKYGEYPLVTLAGLSIRSEGNIVPIAKEFSFYSDNKTGGGLPGGVTHECDGNSGDVICTCCAFKWSSVWTHSIMGKKYYANKITGCKCNQNPGNDNCPGQEATCSHKISVTKD